ncbi:hypothetical protein BGZ96_004431 [Linnemannia gamsii]|uniref:Protein kinase domain-containing protein n=1 Tax=Linnemannia gamsii TaxID=64522 RepID=A0ABQ7K5Q7_9FUNG|nr:hypothetical protein BGZ96_004431 [Linnemannia gamsii]
MTNNRLHLFCLVDGEGTSNAFSVKIASSDTVDDLKNLIKSALSPQFDDIPAKNLTLWSVSIPIDDDQDEIPVVLDRVITEGQKKLKSTTRLLQVFDTELPHDTIHIIVQQRRLQALVSEFDFMQRVPSAIRGEDQYEGPGVSSHSSTSVTPLSIQSWPSFLPSVNGMVLERVPQYQRPRFKEDRTYIPETSLQDLFSYDFGSTRILPPNATTLRIMALPRGSPDLVCRRAGHNTNAAGAILFPIEIKRPVLLQSHNLVDDYKEQLQYGVARGPGRALQQIFGYMRLNGYSYGVLSTYEQTWFLLREGMTLMVSPTIVFNQVEPSFLQCYVWFIRQADANQGPLDPPSDQEVETFLEDERQHRERGQKGSPYRSRMTRFKHSMSLLTRRRTRSQSRNITRVIVPTFDCLEVISHDEHAQTYKSSWHGAEVIVKKCDIWNERQVMDELRHEALVYQALRSIQGLCIPRLRIAGVADGMEMLLVTDFVGTNICQERLEDSDREKIRATLAAIHDLGVVHGDILPQNIVVQRDGLNTRYYFVDFGSSWIAADHTDFQKDTIALERLLQDMAA